MGRAVAAGQAHVRAAQPRAARPAQQSPAVTELARHKSADQTGRRLDHYMAKMQGPYVVNGAKVHVTPHFRTLHGESPQVTEAAVGKIRRALGDARFTKIGMSVRHATGSRGSPAQVRETVQALIDAGALRAYSEVPPEQAIRRMMWDYRIGLDCRGYVGGAALYSRGTGDRSAPLDRMSLDMTRLTMPNNAFRTVPITTARAGDWLHLKPDAGGRDHNVIVRSNTVHRVDGDRPVVRGKTLPSSFAREGWPAGSTPSVRVFEVDSSWGGGERGDYGGVERRVWVHNEKSGQWAHWDAKGQIHTSPGPYAHDLDAVYRPRREP
jgi:hypothetical protein